MNNSISALSQTYRNNKPISSKIQMKRTSVIQTFSFDYLKESRMTYSSKMLQKSLHQVQTISLDSLTTESIVQIYIDQAEPEALPVKKKQKKQSFFSKIVTKSKKILKKGATFLFERALDLTFVEVVTGIFGAAALVGTPVVIAAATVVGIAFLVRAGKYIYNLIKTS